MLRRTVLTMALGGAAAATAGLAPAFAQATTVRMWTFLNPAGKSPREVALAQIIDSFQKANPGVKIVVEPQAWDQMTPKFLAAHNAGGAPDIIWVVTDFLGDAIKSGSLASLNDLFIKNWSKEQIADRAGAYWDLTNVGGVQHALFTSRNYIAIAYRKDLFAEAGIDPAGITSWDKLVEAATKLTQKDASGQVTRYGFAQGFSENQADPPMMIPYLLGKGGKLFNDDGTANFASPEAVEALTFQTDLITRHKVMSESAVGWTVDDVYEQFASGRAAMIMGASVRISTLQSQLGKDKIGFMMWPGAGGKPHSPAVMAGWAVGVWSKSPVKREAGQFVDYMLGALGDKVWVEVGGQSPALASTLDGLGDFAKQPGNEYLRTVAEGSAKYGYLPPIDISIGGYRQILNKAAQHVVVGKTAPKKALEDAAAEFNRANKR
ncbi:sugar ABC transporter substrate-binding protein [Bosea sp. (in: a-proteobacteria)]|uniref:ABC transporter substrate-binding protein n=1 Tax=Bosea sp. (in: a-proteobacteria) TaxID=1871050 RepID=UPI0026316A51|nr:sugar ABC transporter substrate-binding protein [Bosea sp. (in: a-proteobacteria)]MCO5090994.1 sugar ABC transporter substrate-binding protein [Bosea sp. (in: a-proteobacteria)]